MADCRFAVRQAPTTMRLCPPKVSTAALIPDDLPRARLRGIMSRHTDCNPTYLTLTQTYRFRGMVSTLLNTWRNTRVVSGTVGLRRPRPTHPDVAPPYLPYLLAFSLGINSEL